jgi:hypothetical protein
MSVLFWMLDNWKVLGFISLCAILGGFYGYHTHTVGELQKASQKWQERAQSAEAALASMVEEKARLTAALEAQEQATAEAQANRKIVYRTVKEEVAKDETARDWYNAPMPPSLVRVLQGAGAKKHD